MKELNGVQYSELIDTKKENSLSTVIYKEQRIELLELRIMMAELQGMMAYQKAVTDAQISELRTEAASQKAEMDTKFEMMRSKSNFLLEMHIVNFAVQVLLFLVGEQP